MKGIIINCQTGQSELVENGLPFPQPGEPGFLGDIEAEGPVQDLGAEIDALRSRVCALEETQREQQRHQPA